jgi:hypothetical protein
MEKIKILVVGAGTAGWLAASAIKKQCPDADVTIVYDSNTPTVGVGETLGFNMPGVFHDLLGLEDDDWFDQTDAVYKTALLFENWRSNCDRELAPHFYEFDADYLFNATALDQIKKRKSVPSSAGPNIVDVWYTMYRTGMLDKKFDGFPGHGGDCYHFALNNKSIRKVNGDWLVNKWTGYSYQYDAELVGTAIGKLVGRPLGVKVVDAKVSEVLIGSTGITGIQISDGSILTADLYIDCTGFKSLLAKELENTWVDFDEYYNNTALVTPIQYNDSGHELHKFRPMTVLAGMDSGWSFSVSTRRRSGNGYIFNTRQESNIDKISAELRKRIGVGADKNLRMLQWRPGYYKNIWQKNCLALGLSMGFSDPSDANNIGLVALVLKKLIKELSTGVPVNQEKFNQYAQTMWEDIDLRVQTTLRLSPRRDTDHYKLMARVADETNLKQRWFDHLENIRTGYFTKRDQFMFPLRNHISLAVRYGINLPMLEVDQKYYGEVNKYFNYINDRGLTASMYAPTSEEYYASRAH